LSTPQSSNESNPRVHFQGGTAVFETDIERIKREQAEARKREEEYTQRQVAINEQQLRVNRHIATFTVLLFFVSFSTSVISIWEALIASRNAESAKTSAELAIDSFEINNGNFDRMMAQTISQTSAQIISAKAAKEAAEISRDTMIRGNRPWVGVEGGTVPKLSSDPVINGNSLSLESVEYQLKNYGNSPALYVNLWVSSDVMEMPRSVKTFSQQEDMDSQMACKMAETETRARKGVAVIGNQQGSIVLKPQGDTIFPGNTIRKYLPIKLVSGGRDDMNGPLVLFGCIAYQDQFNSKIRSTKFCYSTFKSIKTVKSSDELYPCAINQNAE